MVGHLLIVCNAGRRLSASNRPLPECHNHLLDTRNMSSNVFNGNRVFDGQSVALAFYPSLVDEHSTIGCETW